VIPREAVARLVEQTRPTLRAIERFLLPNACVACSRNIERDTPDGLICSACRWRMKPLLGGCARCGQPEPPVGGCRVCAPWPGALRWARSAVWLGPEAREVVHRLKYDGFSTLACLAADVITRNVSRPVTPDGAVLIPIPLTPDRLRRRGYNQADRIAQALGERWRTPVARHVLLRHRDAPSQTRLMAGARGSNVAGAFLALSPPAGRAPAIIIVDDVFTTGATISAAAVALSDAGWPGISAVTFARALPVEARLA
jgi:ComF family protein